MASKQIVSTAAAAFLVLALDGCANRSAHVSDGTQIPAAAQAPGQPGMPAAAQAPGQPPSAVASRPLCLSLRPRRLRTRVSTRCGPSVAQRPRARFSFLGPGDLLEITVPRVDEYPGDACAHLPGRHHHGCRRRHRPGSRSPTEAQLTDRLKQRLGQTLLRDPQVSLFVAGAR